MATVVEIQALLTARDQMSVVIKGVTETTKKETDKMGRLWDGLKSTVGTVMKSTGALLAAGGAAAGAAFVDAAGDELTLDKVTAKLGLNEEASARLGKVAGAAYSNNFGESLDQVAQVAGEIERRLGGMELSDRGFQSLIEGALTAADVFSVDVDQAIQAAQQLLVNGLAPDAKAAMDIVVASMQGAKGPVDEQLEALSEYSNHFAQIGLSGTHALGALTSEWATNQYAIDKVGDAVKEFGIRVLDGSDLTKDSLEAIGFSMGDVEKAMAEGGPAAGKMSREIISAILAIEDPAKRAQVGVGLMGTPFEDLGNNVVPILEDMISGMGGFVGATKDVADEAYDNVASKAAGAWRTFRQKFKDEIGDRVLPIAADLLDWLSEKLPEGIEWLRQTWEELGPTVMATASEMGTLARTYLPPLIDGVKSLAQFLARNKDTVLAVVAALATFKTVGFVIGFFTKAKAAILGLKAVMSAFVAANPWALLIAGIVALAVLIYQNWDEIKAFLSKTWEWIKTTASAVGDWMKKAWDAALKWVAKAFLNWTGPGLIIKHWDDIKEGATAVKDWIVGKFNSMVTWFTELPGRMGAAVSGMWDGIKNGFRAAVNWIIDKWNGLSLKVGPLVIPDWIPGLGGRRIEFSLDTPNIPRFHDGGIVPGPRGSEVLAVLQAGEEVRSVRDVESGTGGGQVHHHWHISTPTSDPYVMADAFEWYARRRATAGV